MKLQVANAIIRLALLSALAATAACHHSSPTAPSATDLSGTWRATAAQFTSATNSNVKVDAIAKGTTIVLVLQQAGASTLTITAQGAAPRVLTSNWTASADELTLSWTGGVMGEAQFDMTLAGNTLTLNGGHVPYDIDGNGTLEEAILGMTLARQ